MENNFFEFLIIIFFIVSVLQSIFKAKKKSDKKQQKSSSQKAQTQPQQRNRQTKQNQSTQDMLEEIFGLKTQKPSPPKPEPQQRQAKTPTDNAVLDPIGHDKTTWNPEEEYEDSIGISTIKYTDRKEEKPSYQEEMAKLEKMTERSKRSLGKLPDEIKVEEVGVTLKKNKEIVNKIKQAVHNPETLRDYIIVSELLNKPKALRR